MSDLSTKQRKVIAALLSEPTIEQAAAAAGINSSTIRRWRKDSPAFVAALEEAEAAIIEHVARVMAVGASEAADCLREILNDPDAPKGARVHAARAYLATLPNLRLLGSIEARLAKLTEGNNG